MIEGSRCATWQEFLRGWPYTIFGAAYFQFQLIRYIQREFPPPRRVLEVGCGTARLSILLVGLGYDVTATDLNNDFVKALKPFCAAMPGLKADPASLFELPYGDEAFDLVVSQGVMEHFDSHDIIRGIREQLRVAHTVVIDVPNNRSQANFGDERLFTNRLWRRMIIEAGGKVSDFRGRDRVSSAVEFLRPNSGWVPFIRLVWRLRSKTSMFVVVKEPT